MDERFSPEAAYRIAASSVAEVERLQERVFSLEKEQEELREHIFDIATLLNQLAEIVRSKINASK